MKTVVPINRLKTKLAAAEAEIIKLREALKFYAKARFDHVHTCHTCRSITVSAHEDDGAIARAALKGKL